LERNGRHPLFAPIAERVRLRRGLQRFSKAAHAYPELIKTMSDAESYGLVYYMWSLSILSGLHHCDLIVDTGAPSMAARAAATLKADSGLEIDFSGIRPIHPMGLAAPTARAVERSIRSILPFDALSQPFDERTVSRRLGDLSESKADQVFALLDGMKTPWTPRSPDAVRVAA
jgi:hypothetical protein